MNADEALLLIALFWQGFSLSFVIVIWLQRIAPQFSTHDDIKMLPIPYGIRVVLAALGLLGAFGTAALSNRFRGQLVGSDMVVLIGIIVGLAIAFALRARYKTPRASP